MAVYSPILGNLPFGGSAASLPQPGPGLANQYSSAYREALSQNKATYENIMQGYQQTLAAQQKSQAQTLKGYRSLQSSALADLEGMGQERGLQIGEQAQAQRGGIMSRLIGSGLGNSTMLANFTMAANRDEARARNDLAERLAAQRLGVRLDVGNRAQAFRDSANQQNMNTSLAQLAFMNSTMAPYPDASLYSQLASQYGASKVEMNPFKIAMAAGGGLPQAYPGLLPSTGASRPTGGYGPQSPAFYGGYGDLANPMSGASLQQYANFSIPAVQGYAGPTYSSYDLGGGNALGAIAGMPSQSAYQMGY